MGSTSIYSFGEESPIKFEIPDKMAKLYNEAAEEFFKAQTRFTQKFGRKWNPTDRPIHPRWNSRQQKAWNDFATIFARVVADYDQGQGFFHANDIMDDFLIRNASSTVALMSKKYDRYLSLAVFAGVLYGLLRRR